MRSLGVRVVLVSTYELGRQPFAIGSATAWLRRARCEVSCIDLSRNPGSANDFDGADLIAISLPMHTATRLAVPLIQAIRSSGSHATICTFGLYSAINAHYLQSIGVDRVLGAEWEQDLQNLALSLADSGSYEGFGFVPSKKVPKLQFLTPDRSELPDLTLYAHLKTASGSKIAGYTEATRGCKHLCRHCPVVNVYQGAFRVIQHDVVLADIRQQVAAGAQHITFGDPDFWNGPGHARRIVEQLHREFPDLSYDVTIKVEHLLARAGDLGLLRDTGCAFVVTAVESLDDQVLAKLEKGHTRAGFLKAVELCRKAGVTLAPTFIPFTPWTSLDSYRDLLQVLASEDLIENTAPIQLAIRLLIPAGSRLLELADVRERISHYDAAALLHRWTHAISDLRPPVGPRS